MFAAHARLRLPPVELDFDIGLEPTFRIGSTRRVGATWDTRFSAPNPGPGERVVVYFILEGELVWHAPELRFARGSAFVAPSAQFDGSNGRRIRTFRSEGAPFLGIELHVAPTEIAGTVDAVRALSPRDTTF